MKSLMKLMLFSAVLLGLLFFSSGTVCALGGGGSHGDGRTDLVSNAGASSQGSTGDGNVITTNCFVPVTQAVPEPMTLLLLGIGVIGLAGMRRKLRK